MTQERAKLQASLCKNRKRVKEIEREVLNLESVVGRCHEKGRLFSASEVVQTIDNGKGSEERDLIQADRNVLRTFLSPAREAG